MEQPLNGTLSSGNANGQADAVAGRDATIADSGDVIVVDDKIESMRTPVYVERGCEADTRLTFLAYS